MKRVHQLLDYMETHPKVVIRYYASDMILNIHSDASYLSAGKGHSQAGGYFFLGSIPVDGKSVQLNRNVHITCVILKLVAALTAEAELGSLFFNTQEMKVIRLVLHKLGHPQPHMPTHVDNTTAVGIVNITTKCQQSRAFKCATFGS